MRTTSDTLETSFLVKVSFVTPAEAYFDTPAGGFPVNQLCSTTKNLYAMQEAPVAALGTRFRVQPCGEGIFQISSFLGSSASALREVVFLYICHFNIPEGPFYPLVANTPLIQPPILVNNFVNS